MGRLAFSALVYFACLFFTIRKVFCIYDDEMCIPSRQTVERVQACPKTQSSWNEQEKKKHCSSIVHNCSRPLVYHCVINPWQNETIEVCALRTQINQGFCAEYNTGGARIQDSSKCSTCMTKYWSTDAYKYKQCYDAVYKLNNGYNNMGTTHMVDLDTESRETITQSRKPTNQMPNCADSQRKHVVFDILFMICFPMMIIMKIVI